MTWTLQTRRLLLREWRTEDAEAAHAFWGDEETMRFAGGPTPDVATSLRSLSVGSEVFRRHGVCLWPVILVESRTLIGCCGFHLHTEDTNAGTELELGYHFRRSAWGQGYASEAAAACVRYAFEKHGATRIVAYAHPKNVASWRILERLDFAFLGLDNGERAYELVSS